MASTSLTASSSSSSSSSFYKSLQSLSALSSLNAVITVTDRMSSPVQRITDSVNSLIDVSGQAESSINDMFATRSVSIALQRFEETRSEIEDISEATQEASQSQAEYAEQIEDSANASKKLSGIESIKSAFDGFNANPYVQATKKLMEMSDQYTQMRSKINVINDGSQSTADLQNKIFASANRSRTSYAATADAVASLSSGSGNTFSSNDETIQFAENMSKMFTTAGASQEQFQSASQQLTQALGSGVVSADDLNSAFADAPNGIQTLADTMGMPVDKLMEMAKTGQLTSDMIKNAMLGSTEQINNEFANTPKTWGQIWTTIGNYAQKALEPILSLVSLVANNLDVIIPIILGVASAFAVYTLATEASAIATSISTTANQIFTGVQAALNAVLALNPITLIIISIILLIAVIFAVVAIINNVTGSALSAIGIIVGALAVAGAFIYNIVIGVLNSIIQIIYTLFISPVITIVEWVLNVFQGGFDGFGGAVANLIGQIIGWFLSLGKVVTTIIDAIFGTKWTDGLTNLQNNVTSWGKNDKAITVDRTIPQFNRLGYGDTGKSVYGAGDKLQSFIGGKFSNLFNGNNSNLNINPNDYLKNNHANNAANNAANNPANNIANYPANATANNAANNPVNSTLNNMAGNVSNIAGNTGVMADEATTDDENMKYLRQMAERDVIMRYVTPSVSVDMSGMSNHVRNGMDIDGVIDHMVRKTTEAMSVMAEG